MTISRPLIAAAITLSATLAMAAPPENVGTFIGTLKTTNVNHETGKTTKAAPLAIELVVEENNTVTLTHTVSGNTYPCPNAIVGQNYFTYRYTADNAAILIKGKYVGKGRKIKAHYILSTAMHYTEGTLTASKL